MAGEVISIHSVDDWKNHLAQGKLQQKLALSQEYEVEAMPTFHFIKDEKTIDKTVGANKDELLLKITRHVSTSVSASVSA